MSYNLELVVDLREGTLVRLLGLIERRGFTPLGVHTWAGIEPGTLCVEIRVQTKSAPHSVQTLGRHLRRLYEVREVLVATETRATPGVVREAAVC